MLLVRDHILRTTVPEQCAPYFLCTAATWEVLDITSAWGPLRQTKSKSLRLGPGIWLLKAVYVILTGSQSQEPVSSSVPKKTVQHVHLRILLKCRHWFNSSGLESKICIFNQLPDEVVVAVPQTTLWEPRIRNVFYPCSVDAGSEQANKRYTKWPWRRAQMSFQLETRDDSLIFFLPDWSRRNSQDALQGMGQLPWWLSGIRISTEGSWMPQPVTARDLKDTGWPRGCSPPPPPPKDSAAPEDWDWAEPLLQQRLMWPPRPVREWFLLRTGEPSWRRDCPWVQRPRPGGKFTTESKGISCSLSRREFLAKKGSPQGSILEEACHPTPAFLPGESYGQRTLWATQSMGSQESDMT